MKLGVGRVYLSLGDSAWDFCFVLFLVVTCAFSFFTVGCWVYFVFVDCLHCMVMFILNTRDGIYNRFLLCKRKKNWRILPRWLCDRPLPSINEIVFGERASLRVVL